jgi:hypothetical protein
MIWLGGSPEEDKLALHLSSQSYYNTTSIFPAENNH